MSKPAYLHPTAIVEEGATIGEGTFIWHHCHVRDGSVLGRNCVLGKNVYVESGVVLHDGVKVQNNVSLYAGVTLEENVFIGPSVVFTNDRFPRAWLGDFERQMTTVRRGASIGANATIICNVEIGEYAMVAAGTVVTRTVQPHQLVSGNPARHRGWVCTCGQPVAKSADQPVDLRCDTCRKTPE